MLRCSWMSIHVVNRGVVLPNDSPRIVPPNHSFGKKGGGMNDPLRLLAWSPMSRPAGRHLHCPSSGAPDQ